MSADRERIAAVIRALLEKTVANGCTEDEAVAAAAKAAEMLARYNLTLDEVQMRASPFARHTERHEDQVGERLWKVADGISRMVGVRYWISRPGVFPMEVSFFGFKHEVEIARYLLEICAYAMRSHHRRVERDWAVLTPVARRRKVLPFLDGMADRLRDRIAALKPSEPVATGKGLVVLRKALIDAALIDAGIKLGDSRARRSRDFEENYRHGRAAADRVGLNRGLQPGRPAALIR